MDLQLGQIRERMKENSNDLTNKIIKSQIKNGILVLLSKGQNRKISHFCEWWGKKPNGSTSTATTDKAYTPWNWSLKHHLSPPQSQKPLQQGNVTHINACHWNGWKINTANGGKLKQCCHRTDRWTRKQTEGQQVYEENIDGGEWLCWYKSRKRKYLLVLCKFFGWGVCMEAHVLIAVFIFVFKGKEWALFYKSALIQNWSTKKKKLKMRNPAATMAAK